MTDAIVQLAPPVIAVVLILGLVLKILEAKAAKKNGNGCSIKNGEWLAGRIKSIDETVNAKDRGEYLIYRDPGLKEAIAKLTMTIDERGREETEARREQTKWMTRLDVNQQAIQRAIDDLKPD